MQTSGSSTVSEQKQGGSRSQLSRAAQVEALDHALIANLPDKQIRQMTDEELLRVILAANPSVLNEACRQRLRWLDRVSLERLAFLARYCCQNQISRTLHSGKGCHARFNTQK